MGRWLGGREPGRTRVLPQLSVSMGCEFSVAIISLHGFMGSQGEVETTMDTVLLGRGGGQVRQAGLVQKLTHITEGLTGA